MKYFPDNKNQANSLPADLHYKTCLKKTCFKQKENDSRWKFRSTQINERLWKWYNYVDNYKHVLIL